MKKNLLVVSVRWLPFFSFVLRPRRSKKHRLHIRLWIGRSATAKGMKNLCCISPPSTLPFGIRMKNCSCTILRIKTTVKTFSWSLCLRMENAWKNDILQSKITGITVLLILQKYLSRYSVWQGKPQKKIPQSYFNKTGSFTALHKERRM